ncbi:MAG: hypothetical protein ACRDNM_01135 [Gaiellaceae bacterium]
MRNAIVLTVFVAACLATPVFAATSAVPSNTRLPFVSGKAQDGRLLTTSNGQWTGSPTSYAYQWQLCDPAGGSCAAIAGANSKQYTVSSNDVGHRLRAAVTTTNASGSGSSTSRPTGVVEATGSKPAPTRNPSLSGAAQQGSTLSANPGQWSGTQPIRFDYSWQRCDAHGNGCVTFLAHSGTKSYTLTGSDLGHTMRIEVTAYNSHGTRSVFSKPTAVVGAPTPAPTAVAVTRVSLPDRLVIDKVSFSPNPVVSRTAPITARFHVSDTKGLSVQGALVYALGLPYGWVYNAPEQPTDGTGWATITIQPTRALPLHPGDLVMFVRARKAGDSLLAGVSTRRLVQVAIR